MASHLVSAGIALGITSLATVFRASYRLPHEWGGGDVEPPFTLGHLIFFKFLRENQKVHYSF